MRARLDSPDDGDDCQSDYKHDCEHHEEEDHQDDCEDDYAKTCRTSKNTGAKEPAASPKNSVAETD